MHGRELNQESMGALEVAFEVVSLPPLGAIMAAIVDRHEGLFLKSQRECGIDAQPSSNIRMCLPQCPNSLRVHKNA